MIDEKTSQIVREMTTELQDAAKHLDLARAEVANAELMKVFRDSGARVPEASALRAFRILRKKRWFGPLTAAVDTYLQYVPGSPLVQTLYAQALIDQDQLMAGMAVAGEALRAALPQSKAAEEARGLIGRAYKQAFVRAPDPHSLHARNSLQLSAKAYDEAYRAAVDDRCWPAVNLLALFARAQADELDLGTHVDATKLGEEVLAKVEARLTEEIAAAAAEGRDVVEMPWLLASAFEACLALHREKEALGWFKSYLACETADAFEFGSTARQLREIWRLEQHANPELAMALPMLEAELLTQFGGKLDNPLRVKQTVEDRVLQGIFGDERFRKRKWLQRGLDASDAIVRIEDVNGDARGTGFVVRGRRLRDAWGDRPLVMTNAHVVGDPAPERGVHPSRAIVRFTTRKGDDADPGVQVERIEWHDDELDVAVLSLRRLPDPDIVLEIGGPENLSTSPPPSRIYAVGHPRGGDIAYSIYDNELRELSKSNLRYTSPTLDGSSGSALFNDSWEVVGIHSTEFRSLKVNGGTLLNAVRTAIAG